MSFNKGDFLDCLIDSIPDLISFKDNDGVYQACNEAFARFIARKKEDVIGHTDYDFFSKELADFLRSNDAKTIQLGKAIRNDEWVTYPNGLRMMLDTLKTPLNDPKVGLMGVLGISRDITEKNRVEKAYLSGQQKISLLFEHAPIGFAFCNMDGKLLEVNNHFLAIIGHTADEINGLTYWELMPDHLKDDEEAQIQNINKTGPYGPFFKEYIHKDGYFVPVQINCFVVEDYDGVKGIWSVVQDLTEQKKIEEEVEIVKAKAIQASKLATLGEMAAGVAHEINNPLAIIGSACTLIEKLLAEGRYDEIPRKLHMIEDSVHRTSKIVDGLKKFSRSAELDERRNTSIKDIVENSLQLVIANFTRLNIKLRSEISSDALAYCNQLEIEQVLVNLIHNARDAAKTGQEKWVELHCYDTEQHIFVSVKDSGAGISKSHLNEIFNPFFTTKPVGEGTGLGLSISLGIVKDHNGALYYEEESENTTFVLRLNRVG